MSSQSIIPPRFLHETFIYVALPCEAKPFVDFFNLKKDTINKSFSIYRNNHICLTVTGIGKSAMAAGIGYTQALFSTTPHPVILNVGIAGHRSHTIGSIFLMDKIGDVDKNRHYYPAIVFTAPCPRASIQTFNQPQPNYPAVHLCDMEASAFYEIATRFSTGEFIQCLKVVSDNESFSLQKLQSNHVSKLIHQQLSTIVAVLNVLNKLAEPLKVADHTAYQNIISQFHFTETERIQLKKLLSRWFLLAKENQTVWPVEAKNSKDFIRKLDRHLSELAFYL